jgi:methyl coenzyme M reductase subunit D
MKPGSELNVFSTTQVVVDGQSLPRKVSVGKLRVNSVEDENFSVCDVVDGSAEISKALGTGAKLKCELLNN